MKKANILSLLSLITTVAILLSCLLAFNILNISATDVAKDYFETPIGRDEFPYTKPNPSLYAANYSYKELAIYTADEATLAGVPEGYTHHVMKFVGNSEVGIAMDFSDWQIPIALVESLTFRVYVPNNIKEVRLADTKGFIVRHVPSATNEWIDITVYADGTGFNGANFTNILKDDQTLGAFRFCLRYTDSTLSTAYLDGFKFNLKENDGMAPVIQYKGETTIKTSVGKPFELKDLIAYDEHEERYISPVLTWSDGALDANGLLQMGTHTCTATFADYYGNTSTLQLTLEVGEADTEAPVINFHLSTIHATAGTRVDLASTISVTDNYDHVTPVLTWSEGAVTEQNLLLEGTHTLTITATDLSGLQSQKVLTFVVSGDADAPLTPTPVTN